MKYSSDKDLNYYIHKLVQQGWFYKRRSKHGMLFECNGDRIITVPITPRGKRCVKRIKALIVE